MKDSDRKRIEVIKKITDNATDGPWYLFEWGDGSQKGTGLANVGSDKAGAAIVSNIPYHDALFIASAQQNIPWLLEKIQSLEESISNLKEAAILIKIVEWMKRKDPSNN